MLGDAEVNETDVVSVLTQRTALISAGEPGEHTGEEFTVLLRSEGKRRVLMERIL